MAAVSPMEIIGVEIKSEKDKLDRLPKQFAAFDACCHHVIVVAHRKHFLDKEVGYSPKDVNVLKWGIHRTLCALWAYPEPPEGAIYPQSMNRWLVPPETMAQPHARRMLDMLWADELRWLGKFYHVDGCGARSTRGVMITSLAYHLTGREIAEGVCAMLRWREFIEADLPIEPK